MKKIAIILGTRPEIIKVSPVIRNLINKGLHVFIIHSNQHYTANMDKKFFAELKLPRPKYNIGVSFETYHGRMTGKMLIGIEEILQLEKPDLVLVQGDTNTTLAGALTAVKMSIKVGHIEAGLRSYDMSMPEEVNRILTDHISNFLFCPTKLQRKILMREGKSLKSIYTVGNTIVDSVLQNLEIAEKKRKLMHYKRENYMLLTLHRPSNVDNQKILKDILAALRKAAKITGLQIYFPMHPRTRKQIEVFKLRLDKSVIKVMEPVGFLEMLMMEKYAKLILTDSGGLQEEACILNVPCVTIRDNTERPESVEVGANMVVGVKKRGILNGILKMINSKREWKNPFGDGKSGSRIVEAIESLA